MFRPDKDTATKAGVELLQGLAYAPATSGSINSRRINKWLSSSALQSRQPSTVRGTSPLNTSQNVKKVSRNLKGIKVEAVIFVAAVIFLVVCACSRMPRQPASTVPDSSDSTPNERVDEPDGTPSQKATIPTEIPQGETPEIETSEGNKSDQKVDPGVLGSLSPTPQDSGKKKPAKIPGIVQDSLDKLNRGVPADSEDLLPVDDQGRILLEFHAAVAVGASEKADLVALGATIEMITEDLVWPQGAPLGLGIIVAWVPHDQVEAAAAYPWVVAVRPVEENPPDVGNLD